MTLRQPSRDSGAQRTMCMTSSSKEVERELPMWSSRSCGKVSSRYFFFLSEPQVVNTYRVRPTSVIMPVSLP